MLGPKRGPTLIQINSMPRAVVLYERSEVMIGAIRQHGRIQRIGGWSPRTVIGQSLSRGWRKTGKRAKLKGQGEIIRWACQHLSIEIGLALRSDRSVGADFWEQSAEKS